MYQLQYSNTILILITFFTLKVTVFSGSVNQSYTIYKIYADKQAIDITAPQNLDFYIYKSLLKQGVSILHE